jgi:hypothetical protein
MSIEQLRAFVEELGMVWTDNTDAKDLKRVLLTGTQGKNFDELSEPLRVWLRENSPDILDQDCFGKYYDNMADECRRCLEAGNCEILSKGLSTVAYLAGRMKPGNLPKTLGGPGKLVAPPMSRATVSAKCQQLMDWLSLLPEAQLIPRAVYWIVKRGNQNVFTLESVESSGPKYEVLFNRLKDLNSIGGNDDAFKHKYDGWYFIGENVEELKRYAEIWWRLQK